MNLQAPTQPSCTRRPSQSVRSVLLFLIVLLFLGFFLLNFFTKKMFRLFYTILLVCYKKRFLNNNRCPLPLFFSVSLLTLVTLPFHFSRLPSSSSHLLIFFNSSDTSLQYFHHSTIFLSSPVKPFLPHFF